MSFRGGPQNPFCLSLTVFKKTLSELCGGGALRILLKRRVVGLRVGSVGEKVGLVGEKVGAVGLLVGFVGCCVGLVGETVGAVGLPSICS